MQSCLYVSDVFVGGGAADRCVVSTAASDFSCEATTTNPHGLREQVVRI